MDPPRGFRVIIGGGGIAGLTLANCLEQAGIDYVLLEAHASISPQVGASIGILANGSRILDQLGCYEAIEKEILPLKYYRCRYENGEVFSTTDGVALNRTRYNYPSTFLERQTVLRIMYENLKDKSTIKLQKRISKVDHNKNEVIVVCEDGTAVSGDILVGCDGVNSKVRDELWRVSSLEEPDAIDPRDKEVLSAEYTCLFGISTPTKGLPDAEVGVNHSKSTSTMVISGKGGKVFWFMYKKLDKVYKVPNIPRYTKEEAKAYGESLQDIVITPDVKFGEIWKNRVTYRLVATEEAQLKRWSWGRIALVGDVVHKMTPNMGSGGNAAMETAVALANELKKMKDAAAKGKPSFETIRTHLSDYQKVREERISAIYTASNGLTRIHALDTWKEKIFAFWVLPYSGDLFNNMHGDRTIGSVKVDYLPLPDRSLHGSMPFNPSQGLGRNEPKLPRAAKALPFLGITYLAMHYMYGPVLSNMLGNVEKVFANGVQDNVGKQGHFQLLHNFYGPEFVDGRFRGLPAVFVTYNFVDHLSSWQSFSFFADLGVLYAILLIEGARRANILTFASVPLLLGWNMQFMGIGVLMALYCFAHYIQAPIENFRARDMRLTNMGYTATVLPVLVLTYYIPRFATYMTFLDPITRHKWEWIWQPFPLFASILQIVLKYTVMPDTVIQDRIHNPNRDLPTINFTILSLCAFSAATWLYTFASSPFSMLTLFVPNIAAAQTADEYTRAFLQLDEVFSFGACFLWLLYLFGDMKKAGMVQDSWLSIILKGAVTLMVAGPGAAAGLGWLWRERILSTKWHKDALVPGNAK